MPVLEVTDASPVSPSKRSRIEARLEEERPVLRFAKLSEHATAPTRGSAKAAGYDLYRLVIFFNLICTGLYFCGEPLYGFNSATTHCFNRI